MSQQFLHALALERIKFNLSHLAAVLHYKKPLSGNTVTVRPKTMDAESLFNVIRAMNEDIEWMERHLNDKPEKKEKKGT